MARRTEQIMGMPVTLDLAQADTPDLLVLGFEMFRAFDQRFSTYRDDSEVAAFNRGELSVGTVSHDFADVLAIAERARVASGGYFDIRRPDGRIDPSGVVKGWAILKVARRLEVEGAASGCVDAGGDVQVWGSNPGGQLWRVGIRNPFDPTQIVKTIVPGRRGVATSGSYARGHHIYDPLHPGRVLDEMVSLTVVAADVLEADLLATAGFAMGRDGLDFLRGLPDVEAYGIDRDGVATFTQGFKALVAA